MVVRGGGGGTCSKGRGKSPYNLHRSNLLVMPSPLRLLLILALLLLSLPSTNLQSDYEGIRLGLIMIVVVIEYWIKRFSVIVIQNCRLMYTIEIVW